MKDLVAISTEHHIELNTRASRTSNDKQLKLLSENTDIYKHSFFPQTIIDWNLLPNAAVNCLTLESFDAVISRD